MQTRALGVGLMFLGVVAFAGAGVGCDDDSSNNSQDAGSGGSGGTSAGTGGASGGNSGAGGAGTQTTVVANGPSEVPATTSTGTADLTVSWDAAAMMVTVSGTFTGLLSNATAAHIHGPASSTTSAGILLPLTVSSGTSGTVSGGGTLTGANWTAFLGGMTYINIHTSNNPNGEIRGQIVP